MEKLHRFYGLFIILFLVGFSACHKEDLGEPDVNPAKSMDDLIIPEGFNFSATKTVELKIILPFTIDFSQYRGVVKILTAPPEEGGEAIYSGAVKQDGSVDVSLTVPSWYEKVFIWTEAGTVWYEFRSKKSGDAVLDEIINFGAGYGTVPPPDTTISLKTTSENISFHFSGVDLPDEASSGNLIQNGDFSQNSFKAFQDWGSPMNLDGTWYLTYTLTNVAKQYTENNNKVLRITVPTISTYRSGGVAQLIPSYPGDLLTFSADFKFAGSYNNQNRAWLYIIPRDAVGQSIAFYTLEIPNVNNKTSWIRSTVMATMPAGTVNVQILLWQWVFTGAMFWDNIVVTGKINDSDGDGVNDEQDEYPSDNQRAFNVYYPSRTTYNSLAFEDNWPKKGDYDFNDLVTDYQFKQVTNANNALVELFGTFILRAAGAGYTNGFGFQMNLPAESVSAVTGTSITESYINLLASGVEAGQSKGTIILADNVFSRLPIPAGGGIGVNTEPGKPYVTPDTMNVKVTLSNPVSIAEAGSPPYNPFLIINGERGREVHLTGMAGTDLIDTTFYGTWDDDTDPGSEKYFQTSGGLPWAINIPASFAYPVEKTIILDGHLKFGAWAESGGVQYPDWYLDLSGYRNNSALYQEP